MGWSTATTRTAIRRAPDLIPRQGLPVTLGPSVHTSLDRSSSRAVPPRPSSPGNHRTPDPEGSRPRAASRRKPGRKAVHRTDWARCASTPRSRSPTPHTVSSFTPRTGRRDYGRTAPGESCCAASRTTSSIEARPTSCRWLRWRIRGESRATGALVDDAPCRRIFSRCQSLATLPPLTRYGAASSGTGV